VAKLLHSPFNIHYSLLLLLLLPTLAAAQAGAPNDPLYPQQWGLERVGAPCAWQVSTGRQTVIVAVVDSGVDLGHPDLQGRLRKDGFDFVDNDGDPSDQNGHGTHVSGIIAAALDNAEGGVGLAPSVQILPVRVMDARGVGGDRRIAAGIDYAVNQGARVINLSLGSTLLLATPASSPRISQAIRRALDAEIVVVVAAGNDFVPLPNAIVGANEDVIVVAAATRDDRRAVFSNSGPWIDVVAPGERILSTMPTYEVYLTSAALPAAERFTQNYDYMSGTSQAAPFVSALAALLISAHPDWGVRQVTEAIKAAAADIYPNMPSYYRRLQLLGSGRIDACAAMGGAASAPGWPIVPIALGAGFLLLTGGAGAAAALLRRRRPASRPAPPPPGQAAPPHLGDTLVAGGPAWGRLLVIAGPAAGSEHRLSTPSALIGRSADATVSIPGDRAISRSHARLSQDGGQASIEDLGSSYGTMVNGRPIRRPTPLRPGDTITIGETSLRYERP
jgi:subtilisin family serine protease